MIAASWKKLPKLQQMPAMLPGSQRSRKWRPGRRLPCSFSEMLEHSMKSAVTMAAPMPKDAIHEPKVLKRSRSAGGQVLGLPAQPAACSSSARPSHSTPNCTAENDPPAMAIQRPSAKVAKLVSRTCGGASRPVTPLALQAAPAVQAARPAPRPLASAGSSGPAAASSSPAPSRWDAVLAQRPRRARGTTTSATSPKRMQARYHGARRNSWPGEPCSTSLAPKASQKTRKLRTEFTPPDKIMTMPMPISGVETMHDKPAGIQHAALATPHHVN
mmetsp:Transcript_40761/g.113314  ORF Transcript_40761/g.113314 Transcript_40761/m.113314 type:complete len:273 (-) Transcript_40761:241-1059(-)